MFHHRYVYPLQIYKNPHSSSINAVSDVTIGHRFYVDYFKMILKQSIEILASACI